MKRGLAHAWIRLFGVQSSFNYERMNGIGAARALEPLIRDLPGGPGGERYREALKRGVGFFNSHPYFVGIAVGAVARAEHEGVPGEQIERLRSTLTSPLGSMGDRLIWAGVLPFAAGVGLAGAAVAPWFVGPAVFLVLYNAVHLALRTWALAAGWRSGLQVARALASPLLQWGLRLAGPLGAAAVGFSLPLVWTWLIGGLAPSVQAGTASVAAVGAALTLWLAPTLGGLRFGLGVAGLTVLVAWLWR
ncbi:MAG: PTS system mannose/fructose/sorbose family transporter subunit IID [Gemmatimonadetes bacterium]|nr:PTS system mannose/fructose/sorbose family transporter subunit IID [Gemmatimonadota bacterium]